MNPQLVEHIGMVVTAIVSIIGVVTGFLALRSQKKKDTADATESIAEAAKTLIEPLRQRVEQLEEENEKLKIKSIRTECELKALKERLKEFEEGTERLIFQLKALNAEPVWLPKEQT